MVRWFLAVAIGAAIFEALDAFGTGSGSSLNGRPNGPLADVLLWLPVVSPGIAGFAAAWIAPPVPGLSLLASVASVWARMGADRFIGALHGAQLSSESGVVLVLAFGLPWSLTALIGGLVLVAVRAALSARRRSSAAR